MKKTRFPYRMWHWVRAGESLFDMNKEELAVFSQFVNLANQGRLK